VNVLGNLLLVPLFLRAWSTSVYGEWLTLSSAVAYLSTLDFGVQTYAVNRLTQAYKANNLDDYRDIQHTAIRFYALIAFCGTAIAFGLACLLPFRTIFNIQNASVWETRAVITLLAAQVLTFLLANFISSAYQTMGDLALSEWIYQLQRAALLVALAVVLLFKPPMWAAAAVQLVPIGITITGVFLHLRRRFPQVRPGIKAKRHGLLRTMMGPSLLFGLIALAQLLTLQGSTLIIATAISSAAVALYVTSRTLANLARQFLGLLSSASWTEFTLLDSGGNRSGLKLAFHVLLAVGGSGCIAIAASLWFEGASVIATWTGGKLVADVTVLRLLLLQVVLGVPWIAASTVGVTTNQHRRLAISYIVSSTLGIGISFAGVHRFGLAAVPAGLIIGEAIASYHFVLRDACRVVDDDYVRLARRVWGSLILTAVTATLVAWCIHLLGVSWRAPLRWLLSGIGTGTIGALAGWTLWLLKDERDVVRRRLGARIRRRYSAS
jgi:O-antigen/teichoic acid export membrane protein